jgi:uncharacterized membrane protein YeaQ/YmgE (transglycosylase-associated protein family)
MSILYFLIVGIVSGWLAGKLMKGSGFGLIGNLVVGVIGALVGGLLFDLLDVSAGGLLGNIIMATVGAIVLLWLLHFIKRGKV